MNGFRPGMLGVFGLGLLVAVLCGCEANRSAAAPAPRPPNILFILADDFGRELLPCYGGQTDYQTPRLEALAAAGMRFENCYATPICAPSRVELLTGRYSFRNYQQWGRLDSTQATFAQRLRQAGYATALAGKWQLGGWDQTPAGIVQAGFDEYCTYHPDLEGAAARRAPGNIYWGGKVIRNGKTELLEHRYGPDVDTNFLVDFMKRHRTGPFLAYYCMTLVHRPFHATPEHAGAPGPGEPPPRAWLNVNGKTEHFAAMVRYADRLTGKLLDALGELGLAENTIVIFTSDNGTDNVAEAATIRSRFMDRKLRGGKYFPTELGVNVPLLVRWPGRVAAGSTNAALVDFTDFFPTLCGLAGAKLPENHPLDGRDIVPLLRGEQAAPKPVLYSWGNFDQNSTKYKQPAPHARELLDVVRDDRWKLYSDGRLFDLKHDFLEREPVVAGTQPAADAARERLAAQLRALRATEPKQW